MIPSARTTFSLALSLLTAGCGTIFNGTRQTVIATSAPDQASITVEPGGGKFTAPASLSLERKNDYNLTFTKEGYSPATFQIQHKMNAGILVLDILAGLVGVMVDAATGGWNNLSPESAQIVLTKVDGDVSGPEQIRVILTGKGQTLRIESTAPGVSVGVARP